MPCELPPDMLTKKTNAALFYVLLATDVKIGAVEHR